MIPLPLEKMGQPISLLSDYSTSEPPNILLLRPADGNETSEAHMIAVLNRKRLLSLLLSTEASAAERNIC
jgi:transketolase